MTLASTRRLALRLAFLLVLPVAVLVSFGAREVRLEGEAVEAALDAGYRLRLEGEAARLRAAAGESERALLARLPALAEDSSALRDAVQALDGTHAPPASSFFAVAADGALLYPSDGGAPRAPLGPTAAAEAAAELERARELAGKGDVAAAASGYRRFLAAFPGLPAEPEARALARVQVARLELRRGDRAAAGAALLDLERELAREDLARERALTAFYRARADGIAVELGGALEDLGERQRLRREGDEHAARARLLRELHGWLAARIRLELQEHGAPPVPSGSAITGTASPVPRAFAETVRGERRRFAFRAIPLRGLPAGAGEGTSGPKGREVMGDRSVAGCGFEVDPTALREKVLRPLLPTASADGVAIELSPAGVPATPPAFAATIGPDFPPLDLHLRFEGEPPAARAARSRRLLLGSLAAGSLALVIAALALALRHAERTLALSRMKADFVAAVSHELRTPLSLIRAVADTLELGHVRDEDESRSYLRMLSRECERLSALIGNVLDFARAERGRARYDLAPIDPAPVVESLVETWRPSLEGEGFAVRLEVAPDVPRIEADGEALSRAVLNLIDNARKYSPETKAIDVAVRAGEGCVRIEVRDCGIGIAPEDRARIFEPFYRSEAARARAVRGAGLGLAIVRQIVEGHGGSVEVASEVGKGSTFAIVIGAMTEPPAASRVA